MAKKAKENIAPLLDQEDVQEVKSQEPTAKVARAKIEAPVQSDAFDPKKEDTKAQAQKTVKITEEQQHVADLERFKKEIEKAPKVQFHVPLDPGEKPGAVQPVSLNGVSFTIKKGAMVLIPQPIADVLAEKYQIEMTAGREMLIDRSDEVEDALS